MGRYVRLIWVLGFVVIGYLGYSSFIFTEEFDDLSNVFSYTMSISNGVATIGYPDVHGWYNWNNEWGNYSYYNGYIYVVWSDRRYDGYTQIFLTKINTNGNIVFSTNIEISIIGVTNSYSEFAMRPTISVYDLDNIYVSFVLFKNSRYYSYTTKWRDTGATFELLWSKRVDNGVGDNISYTPIPVKLSSTVGPNGELYLLQVWFRSGSGDRSYISKILPDGTQYWLSSGLPGTEYLTLLNGGAFIIGGEVIYSGGFVYVSGQHWIWSPDRDFGVGVNKISTNNTYSSSWGSGTNITTDRGIVYNNTMSFAPRVSMVVLGGSLYVTFADQRNGNMDIFLAKVNTNTGSREWTKPIATTSAREDYPSITYDSVGNLYISYVEWSTGIPLLRIAKVDKDTGNVLGVMSDFGGVLYNPSQGFILPKLFVDNSGAIYIMFKDDGGEGRVKLKVAKYDGFAGNLLWLKELPEISYKKYAHIVSRSIFYWQIGSPISVRINSQFSGNPVFQVSPDGGVNWYNANTNEIIIFTNLGNDLRVKINAVGDGYELVSISNYTIEVLDYLSGDLIVSTNSSFTYHIGSNLLSKVPGGQIITNYVFSDGNNKSIFYTRFVNIGNTNGTFYFYLTPVGWNSSIFDASGNNVSTAFTNGYYSNFVASGMGTNFRIEVSVPSSALDGEFQDFYLYSTGIKGGIVHDAFILRTVSWKYLPDMFISNSSGIIGRNVWELTPYTQIVSNLVNSMFYGYETPTTNFIVISNGGILPDVVEISNLFTVSSGNISDWNISVFNVSDNQSITTYPYNVSLNVGQSKIIMVVVSPKTSAPTGSFLNLVFFTRSTNAFQDNIRKDSVRLVYENHKYQPDLIISTNLWFIGGVGEGLYTSTNTSITQSIMVRTVNNRSLTYYFKLRNDGLEGSVIGLRASRITNSGWSQEYYDTSSNLITFSITNGTNIYLGVGEEFVFWGVYTPDDSVDSGVEPWVSVVAFITNFTNAFDVVFARPRNIKVKPDVLIGYTLSSMVGNDVYNSTGAGQYVVNVLRKGGVEIATNIVIIQNDSATDPDIINIIGGVGNSKWVVKYLDFMDNDITHNITNTTNLTLPLGSSITLKVVSYPTVGASDDEWFGIPIRAYSSYVASQEDVVVVSNRAVTIKPDIGVWSSGTGWIDIPTIASSYEEQSILSNKIIAGFTNTIRIKLKNDTGSRQEYIFKVSLSNVGGSFGDWEYKFFTVSNTTTNDLTSVVTNNGWTNEYLPDQSIEVIGIVSVTNAVEFDINTTNGAVSNMFMLRYDFVSVFRTNIVDKGMHSFVVVRGLPDAYHESMYKGLGIVSNEFSSHNYVMYGLTKNYPRNDIVLKFRNIGDYRDKFRIFATLSNGNQPGNSLENWIFKFFDENTNDITSLLTNTNVGWISDINVGMERTIRMEIVNSNGYVNDNIFFYFYFETLSKERRLDTIWLENVITPGLPDVLISNITTGILKASNQFAPDSSDYQKIETNEMGRFRILMRNIAPIEGSPTFRLKATLYGDISKFDVYHTNKAGEYVDLNELVNFGYTNNISNYNAMNNWPEDYLTLYVVPKSIATSGDKIIIRYEFSLYDNPGVYDVVFITNQLVKPRVSVVSLPSFLNNVTIYVGKYQSVFGVFAISNLDNVWEQFVLRGTQSNPSGWNVSFFTNSTDISSSVLSSSGFTTEVIEGGSLGVIYFRITNTSELVSGTTNTVLVDVRSKKNTNVSSTLRMDVVYVDAVADIFVKGEDIDNSQIVGFNTIGGEITNKIEIYETNFYRVYLSNSINAGSSVRFVVSVESNYSPLFITKFYDENNNDITSLVFSSNYIISLSAGESKYIWVSRILTNTNSLVSSGFHTYLRLSMNTYDVQNNIYDTIVLRDVVVDPKVDVRSASALDNIYSFMSYSDQGKSLRTFKNIATTVYLGVYNVDNIRDEFYIRASGSRGVWSVKYYDLNNNDITESVVNGTYITPTVDRNSFYVIKTVIKPSVEVNPSDVFEQIVEVWSAKNTLRKDYITNRVSIESMFIVGSVKDKKDRRNIPKPIVEVVDPYGVKVVVEGDNDGNYSAPVYPVIGGLYKMKVDAKGYVGVMTNIYFEVGTNVVNFELVGMNMSDDKTDVRIFPNPTESRKGGSVVYAVNRPSYVNVAVYDLKGKLIKRLVRDERKEKGVYYVIWDGTDENGAYVNQGVYVLVINNGEEVVVKKLFIK